MKKKTWSRKGRCPSCRVSTGSKHSKACTFDYTRPKIASIKTPFYLAEIKSSPEGIIFDLMSPDGDELLQTFTFWNDTNPVQL